MCYGTYCSCSNQPVLEAVNKYKSCPRVRETVRYHTQLAIRALITHQTTVVSTENGGQSYVIFYSMDILHRLVNLRSVLAGVQIKCKKCDLEAVIWYTRIKFSIYNFYRAEIILVSNRVSGLRPTTDPALWYMIHRPDNILVSRHKSIWGWEALPSGRFILIGHYFREESAMKWWHGYVISLIWKWWTSQRPSNPEIVSIS